MKVIIAIYLIMGCIVCINWLKTSDFKGKVRVIPLIICLVFGLFFWPVAWYKGSKL